MKATKLALALLAATGISAIATPVMAYEAGDWLVRGRIAHIAPKDDSGQLYTDVLSPGAYVGIEEGVGVDSDTIPELDITYMIAPNWGVELILGYSEHTVTGEKGATASSLGDVIDAKVLPPTLLLQYHFAPNSNIRPYVGAGINYTYFFDEKVVGSVLPAAGDDVKLDSSWGFAVQAGVDIAINDDWFVNADIKYIDIDTEAHFSNVINGAVKANINTDIDPFVYGIGIGRRF